MSNSLQFEIIYPKILVYKNVFKDCDLFLENAKKCKDWEKWYSFGTMLALKEQSLKFNNFPTKEEYVNSRKFNLDTDNDKLLTDLTKEVGEIFYDVTSHFLKLYPEESLSNYVKNSASVNKYLDNQGITKNYAMTYHTDFIYEERDWNSEKFGITTTFYLNDNYENGEICFKIKNHYISHKPKKGDVIVFPSKSPYFHAVRKASGSDRYMIRSFWQYDYSGSDEWLKNQKKHGKEEWYKMEKDRIKKERDYLTYSAERLHKFFGKDNGVYK